MTEDLCLDILVYADTSVVLSFHCTVFVVVFLLFFLYKQAPVIAVFFFSEMLCRHAGIYIFKSVASNNKYAVRCALLICT